MKARILFCCIIFAAVFTTPDLAKRIVSQTDDGSRLGHMTAEMLINGVRRGGGQNTPEDQRQRDVTVLDIFDEMAA